MNKINQFLELWDVFSTQKDSIINGCRYESEREGYIAFLISRINALGSDLMSLAKDDRFSSSFVIARSMLESSVNLHCLMDDEDFIYTLKYDDAHQESILLKNIDENNPYNFFSNAERKSRIAKCEKIKIKCKESSPKIYTRNEDKFKKANAYILYRTIYNRFCQHAHGNLSVLTEKHASSEGVNMFANILEEEKVFVLSSTVNSCIQSMIELINYFSIEGEVAMLDFLERSKQITSK